MNDELESHPENIEKPEVREVVEGAQETKAGPVSIDPAYFEKLYQSDPDPWNFESSPYEAERHKVTLQVLPRPIYHSAFEIGCSTGVLTKQLAPRCEALLAVDLSQLALQRAKVRCQGYSQVTFELRQIPHEFPSQNFDLILFSEVGYYMGMEDLLVTRQKIIEHLVPGGHLLMVHWTPEAAEYPLTGDKVHEVFLEGTEAELRQVNGQRETFYRIDLLERL